MTAGNLTQSPDPYEEAKQQRWGLSNSRECLASLKGKRIVGFLENALPVNNTSVASGTKTLVFEDGTGFTFKDGAFWHVSADEVTRALVRLRIQLEDTGAALASLLDMAGARHD